MLDPFVAYVVHLNEVLSIRAQECAYGRGDQEPYRGGPQ